MLHTDQDENIAPEPFDFVTKILDMDLEMQMEIYPEVGSTENIFKYYTFEEAWKRYVDYCNK